MGAETVTERTTSGLGDDSAEQAPRTVTVDAPDEKKARASAAAALSVPPQELQLRVLSRQKRGLFGLGGEVLRVEATWVPPPPPPPEIPGRLEITCSMGRLSLAAFRPQGRGRMPDAAMLDEMVAGWPLDARDDSVVAAVLRAADGQPRVFATMSPSTRPVEGAPAAVKASANELTAWLIPWADAAASREAIVEVLAAAGVTAGIGESILDALDGAPLRTPVVIARGQEPREGQDAYPDFVYQALSGEKKGPTIKSDGTVDFREMGGPTSVEPGDVLVRKVPLVPAENGYTVRGKALAAKPAKDLDLKRLAGTNTAVTEDGLAIQATAGGLANRVGDKIVVMAIHTVDGDVDFRSGNVNFDGNLQIRGGVKPGFKVTASGNIQIGATIEASQIDAGGDVVINGGIVGQGEGLIRAGGAVTARFAEGAEIHAGGPVTIGSEVRQSTVISEKSVTVAGAGRIVGGLVRGRDFVEARVLGSQTGTPTTVQAGWGEQLDVEVQEGEVRIPKVIVRGEVNGGVLITVAGASQRYTHPFSGGVWRNNEGKLQYSAS